MTQATVLVVEDDAVLRMALSDTLQIAGFDTRTAQDGYEALELLDAATPAMVITDIQMPRMDGHALLKKIKMRWPDLPVLLMTAYGSVQKAVEAMQDGAADYLTKPFDAEVLIDKVARHVAAPMVAAQQPVAADAASRHVFEMAARVATTDVTVMITGESGTGKEVLARYIHDHSARAAKPFIAINCAAIPDNMLEATLFGYDKGAFTGAYKSQPGKFEAAQGGTLLLDEISEMDLALQSKLLRVLQEREVERIGGSRLIELDVRVLATSNRNLREEVAAGRFREDLFYRLNVFPLHVPPLRSRPEDVNALAGYLLSVHATRMGRTVPVLTSAAKSRLMAHTWPGNVRELENLIQRTLILHGGGQLGADDLVLDGAPEADQSLCKVQAPAVVAEESDGLLDHVRHHEFRLIEKMLHECMGNRRMVAERLGISERTLRYKLAAMREKGIGVPGRHEGRASCGME